MSTTAGVAGKGGGKGLQKGAASVQPVNFQSVPPNQTLYINGLNEKVKIPELKCLLLELFASYGEVIDVVAAGSLKRKGQAFVIFRDISCATNALRALNGFVFMDKPMRIVYSRTKSDIVAIEDGTYKPRAKAEKLKDASAKQAQQPVVKPKTAPPTRAPQVQPKFTPQAGAGSDAADGQPSNVLFVENLPAEVNEMMLTMLFRQYPGFQEARLIKGRNVAFIEYADEVQAGIAKHGLQGFMVTPEMALKIAFAKQ